MNSRPPVFVVEEEQIEQATKDVLSLPAGVYQTEALYHCMTPQLPTAVKCSVLAGLVVDGKVIKRGNLNWIGDNNETI